MRKSPPDLFRPSPKRRAIAYDFVLEQLEAAQPSTRAMFGSTAVYLDERVVFILRQKGDSDDGVWFAYEPTREPDVLALLPSARRIDRIPNARGWRMLAAASPSFEEDVLRACRIAREDDSPLGKIPVRRTKKRAPASPAQAAKNVKVAQKRAPHATTRAGPPSKTATKAARAVPKKHR